MLENTLELTTNTLGCSPSSIELSPKENLSSSSSTSSRSGSLYNYKSKIKRLRKQNLRKIYLRTKFNRISKAKLGYLKAKRYASLSSASSTSSSVSSSPNNSLEQPQSEEKHQQTKKPMKLHKFYHSVPFKCPFCFTFKEIPQDFIDHLTSVHFSDVKLLYERKCTKLIESGENQLDEATVANNLAEIPSKLRKMIKDLENEEENETKEEMLVNDEENDECLTNQTKNIEKEQEIHTPPKTPPSETKPESIESPKSSYLTMNSALLPPRKQQRLLKSPFEAENNQNTIKNLPFSVPALLSDQQQCKTNYMSLNMTNNHQTVQSQEASMKCAICDRGFEYYSNLRRHIKTKHKIFGKQVKEYVIRHNAKKSDNDQYYKNFIESSTKTASQLVQNPVSAKKQKSENDESFDDDIDESQAELASSTSTTSSFSTHSSNTANLYANQTNPALMAAAALSTHFPAHVINQQQMMAFLTHSNTMNKLKSSLLESLLNRKMPDQEETKDDTKVNQFSKLIQNIVEMNQFNQLNNASVLAAMNHMPKVKNELIEENENSVQENESRKENDGDLYDEDKKEDIDFEENDENKADGDDLDNDNEDMRSRTSSSRSFHSDGQSNHLTPPSVTPSKFMFNNPLGSQNHAPPINQFVLETHLRNLTQQNFSHQAYQAYQQNLHRFNLANQSFLNANPVGLLNQQQHQQQQQSIGQMQTGSSAPSVPGTVRRKKSKDFSTSSMVQSMRNLQCSPSSQQNSDQNIRFSSEIWRCPYCCYETTSASRYNSHLVCHGWKPYLCPHCGSRSNRLPDMRTHISTFHPEFNVNTFVVLSEEEAKSTLKDYMKNRALINRKLKEMRPQPKFKCKLCPYASLYQFNLTKHVKSVHLSDVYHNNTTTPTPSQNQNASQDS